MYVQATTFVTGRIHSRHHAPVVLDLIAGGAFDPSPVTTRVIGFDEAADALVEGQYTKLIFIP
jgi:alcohol dehydrogenase